MTNFEDLRNISDQAERDLNSYQAKTGAQKTASSDEAGVDTSVEHKFPGAEVKYGEDLSTNASYNKRIPPSEGGELDKRGRQTRGELFEGKGGPEQKLAAQARDHGGDNDNDVPGFDNQNQLSTSGLKSDKGQFKGSDYYTPESVPDSISAEGNIPPASVTQASREAENS